MLACAFFLARRGSPHAQSYTQADVSGAGRNDRKNTMTWWLWMGLVLVGLQVLRAKAQRERIGRLAAHLAPLQIEQLMQQIIQDYFRALAENDAQRQAQIWQLQGPAEQRLVQQVRSLAETFSKEPVEKARTLRVAIPGIEKLLPQASFDTRKVLGIHAQAIADAVNNAQQRNPKERAFVILAEMYLLQHSCLWFCRSKTAASARLLAQHQTRYEQVLQSVDGQTQKAYQAVVSGPAVG
jgi:hypothetical protein